MREVSDSSDSAFASLYQRWRAPLVQLLRRRRHSQADAEDVVQEVFLRMASSRRELAEHEEAPYLKTAARNVCIDAWRRDDGASHAADEPLSTDTHMDEAVAHRQRLARLHEAVNELPPRQREAFMLNRIDGLSHDEVAQAMGISPRMVAKHLSRALAYCHLRVQFSTPQQMTELNRWRDGERS